MNSKRFTHTCRHGCEFIAERCDFSTGVKVHVPMRLRPEEIAEDAAQMAGYHAANILPKLNGFAGYDVVKFTFYST